MVVNNIIKEMINRNGPLPFSKEEYCARLIEKSKRLLEVEEQLIILKIRYDYLKSNGKELPEENG